LFFLIVITLNDGYASIKKTYSLLKGCSPWLAYDFRHNLYIAFVKTVFLEKFETITFENYN